MNAHKLGKLGVANPDLSGHGIPNAQVLTRNGTAEILARLPVRLNSGRRFIVPPVGGHGMNVAPAHGLAQGQRGRSQTREAFDRTGFCPLSRTLAQGLMDDFDVSLQLF